MNKTYKPWLNGALLLITLAINTFGAMGYFNGNSQKQISDMYFTFVTPSPSTFSIWGIIYMLLLASVVVMIVKQKDPYYSEAIEEISVLFIISCVLNSAWIVMFSFLQIELSALIILGFEIVLAMICLRLLRIENGKHWLLPVSFGIYTGWLFIATVVNIAAALVKQKWDGFGLAGEAWAAIILGISVFLVAIVLFRLRNAVFPLPVAWAYYGIFQSSRITEQAGGDYSILQITAIAGGLALVALALIQFFRNRFAVIPRD